MFRWLISIFGKTPARSLGIITAPDEAAARTKAIEYFHIEPRFNPGRCHQARQG
jgi:hypothetical protein